MNNFTLVITLIPTLYLFMYILLCVPLPYKYLTITKKRTNEAVTKFTSESLILTDNNVKGFIVIPHPADACSKIEDTWEGEILLIPTYGCSLQQKLLHAGRAGFSSVIFYGLESPSLQNDFMKLPAEYRKKQEHQFDYVGKINYEDAMAIKHSFAFPKAVRFHGGINSEETVFNMWLKIFPLYHSSRSSMVVQVAVFYIGLLILLWRYSTYTTKKNSLLSLRLWKIKAKQLYRKIKKYVSGQNHDIDFSNEMCSICQELLNLMDTRQLPCKHYFHTCCLESWFESCKKHTCPTCRYRVTSHDEDFELLSDHDSDDDTVEGLPIHEMRQVLMRAIAAQLLLEQPQQVRPQND